MSAENINSFWCDDITFCPVECERMDCPRNQKNIRDRTIPHSYSVEILDDCPKKKEGKTSSVEYLDWYFKYDDGMADKTAVEAWNTIKDSMEELKRIIKELQKLTL